MMQYNIICYDTLQLHLIQYNSTAYEIPQNYRQPQDIQFLMKNLFRVIME